MLDGNNEEIDADRRRFLETAAMTIAASRLGLIGVANTGHDESQTRVRDHA